LGIYSNNVWIHKPLNWKSDMIIITKFESYALPWGSQYWIGIDQRSKTAHGISCWENFKPKHQTKNFSCVSDCKRSLLTDYLHLPPYPGQVGVFERAFACFKATRQVFVGSQANVSRLMSLTFGRNFLSWTDWTSRIAVNFNQLRGWGKLKTGPTWRHLGFWLSSFQSPYFFLREISLANCNR
jgi:hypothetical protein